ncbi:MAG: hypothetical protein J2P58_12285 [Acidimicrobiaceae bacterium]|nr:hypothetical protein [Acidimicrobiaceae bacterium]MBO0746837.1 hypothetical protein [Acidimicrobiaceae bacterium]
MSSSRWSKNDEGFAGGAEGLVFGLLVFVIGTLIVASAWGVVDTKMATGTAASDAARTYVEAGNAADAATGARTAADDVLAGLGRDPSRASLAVTGGGFRRCQRITVRVGYPSPLLVLPFVGRVGRGLEVSSAHSELVDPYRAGLAGTASCT